MATSNAAGVSAHWEAVYRDRGPEEVSWFAREPAMSLRLLGEAGLQPGTSVIDVGGGASVLTDPAVRAKYLTVVNAALSPDGSVVIATFAEDGPESCSGLPVARFSASGLADEFPGLHPVRAEREEHRTPSGVVQPLTWLVLSRQV